jgi:hypothetical protein
MLLASLLKQAGNKRKSDARNQIFLIMLLTARCRSSISLESRFAVDQRFRGRFLWLHGGGARGARRLVRNG